MADTFAFLSNITDASLGVCVEEGPNSAFLSVLLAVNKVKQHDGNQVLRKLRQDLERIFAVLSRLMDGE